MIVIDTETTALVRNSVIPIDQQPAIIELGVAKLDVDLDIVGSYSSLVRPHILPLSAEITKITGIRTEDLTGEAPFAAHYQKLTNLFLGEQVMVAHNLPFDRQLLIFELRRIGKEHYFPYPPQHICTAEIAQQLFGKYLHQYELYEMATGTTGHKTKQKHRGFDDVTELVTIIKWLREEHKAI